MESIPAHQRVPNQRSFRSSGSPLVVPYEDLDPNIIHLVRVLNAIPGITTLESCGGHSGPIGPTQRPEGEWYIVFRVAHNDEGWLALEFLSWAINERGETQSAVQILLSSRSDPGDMYFVLEGQSDPDRLAAWLHEAKGSFDRADRER